MPSQKILNLGKFNHKFWEIKKAGYHYGYLL